MESLALLSMPASSANSAGNGSMLHWWLSNMELLASLLFCGVIIALLYSVRKHLRLNTVSKLRHGTIPETTLSVDMVKNFQTLNVRYVSWLHRFRVNCRKLSPWTSQSGLADKPSLFARHAPLLPETQLHREIRVAGNWRKVKYFATLLAAFTLGYFVKGYRDRGAFPQVEEYRNVKVLQQFSRTEWLMRRSDGDMRWNCCPDFPCYTVIHPGYMMSTFRYEERGVCKSILGDGLGAFWKLYPGTNDVVAVDEDGNIKEK